MHYLLVIFVVAVSACLITGLWISHLTFSNAIKKFYSNSNLPSLWIETDKITAEDESFLSQYEYGKRYEFDSGFLVGGKQYNSTFLVSDGEVSSPYIIEGNKGKGCYVDAKFIEKYKIGIYESKIVLDYTIAGETKRLSFLVLGSFSLAEDLLFDDECVIFIDEEVFLQALSENFELSNDFELEYNKILLTSSLSDEDKENIEAYYESRGRLISIKTQNELTSFEAVEKEIEASSAMLVVFPVLFIAISALVVVSAISELVSKERYNIGLLKSLGIKNTKILSNYCGYGVYMCLIGAILGIVIAPLIVPNISFDTYDILFNLPRDEVKMIIPYWLIFAIIFAVIFIGYFSAFVVCVRFVFRTPKECMQGVQKIKSSKRRLKKRGGIFKSIFKNFKDNPSRTVMSLFAICGCSLLILLGYGVGRLEFLGQTQEKRSFQMFSGIFKGFAMIILFLAIIITLLQILKEKSREIAMQRIHGESYVKVWLKLIAEVFALGVIGFTMACVLAQPIFIGFLKFFGINEIVLIDFVVFLKTFLMILCLLLASSVIALIKVYKTNLVDATKFSE